MTASEDLQSRMRVGDNGSRLGFIVNEDLQGGNRAFITCETGLNIDNGGANGQGVGVSAGAASAANTSANYLCSREGHLGLGNTAYELRLGRQNVYWTHGELNQTGANFLSGDVLGNFVAPAAGMVAGNASRLNNTTMIQLNKDSILGANFAGSHVYYSVDGGEASTSSTAQPNKANTKGFKLNYNNGPLVAMADMSVSKNISTVAAAANNAGVSGNYNQSSAKYSLGYKYTPNSMISYTYFTHKRSYNTAAADAAAPQIVNLVGTALGGRSQDGHGFNLVHDFGNEIYGYAQYAIMNAAKDATNTEVVSSGANGYLIGARKNLSKRTGVFAWYGQIKNEANNAINFTGGAIASGNAGLGADPKITAVGIQHLF